MPAHIQFLLRKIVGSIGAVDGTYSVACRFEEAAQDVDEESTSWDRMYTAYKKCHAYKLVFVTTHMSKYIVSLEIAPGSSSDATVYKTLVLPFLKDHLIAEAAILGDNVFHSAFLVITPYPADANAYSHHALVQAKEVFNHNYSKERMVSEHGNCNIPTFPR